MQAAGCLNPVMLLFSPVHAPVDAVVTFWEQINSHICYRCHSFESCALMESQHASMRGVTHDPMHATELDMHWVLRYMFSAVEHGDDAKSAGLPLLARALQ